MKHAPLSSNLVAVKGSASPIHDMPSRSPAEESQPLNFKVSADFRREFKTFAAQHGLKLNELLRRAFESYRAG